MDALSRLAAIDEIKALKSRYFRGVDLKDWTLLRTVFADDVVCDYRGAALDPVSGLSAVPNTDSDVIKGADNVVNEIRIAVDGVTTVHHGNMPDIEIISDRTAKGLWSMVDLLRFPAGSPVAHMTGYGHYHETYERINGVWKIKTLRLTRLRVDTVRG